MLANPFDVRRQPCAFPGVLVRRVVVELPDEENERVARENGLDLEHVGLLRKCTCGTVDASARS